MNWQDIGGRSKVKHVVTKWNPGIYIGVLCKQRIANTQIILNRSLSPKPHCLKCIVALKKLIHVARFRDNKVKE